MQEWRAPLPPPAVLAHYNDIIPNGADRVMAMAERALAADIDDRRRGPWLGATVSILAIVCSVVTVALGASPLVSVAFLGVPVLGIVNALVGTASRKTRKD